MATVKGFKRSIQKHITLICFFMKLMFLVSREEKSNTVMGVW
jgi:hypothetical protein